jgi:hypothetical protein
MSTGAANVDRPEESPNSDTSVLILGYACYPVPLLYVAFMPMVDWFIATFTRGLQSVLGEVLGGLIVIPLFGALFVFPSIVGPIAIIAWTDRFVVARLVLANSILAALFIIGLATGFSQSRWAVLDVMVVGYLAGNAFRMPATVPVSWGLFAFLVAAAIWPQLNLWLIFDVAVCVYSLSLAIALAVGLVAFDVGSNQARN